MENIDVPPEKSTSEHFVAAPNTVIKIGTGPKAPRGVLPRSFGEMVWLLSQSPAHRHLFLSDLEWFLLPPILLNQFREIRIDKRLVGIALWATLSEKVEKELLSGRTRLGPDEWNSGNSLWLMEVVAPTLAKTPRTTQSLMNEITDRAFGGRAFKMKALDPRTMRPRVIEFREKAVTEELRTELTN